MSDPPPIPEDDNPKELEVQLIDDSVVEAELKERVRELEALVREISSDFARDYENGAQQLRHELGDAKAAYNLILTKIEREDYNPALAHLAERQREEINKEVHGQTQETINDLTAELKAFQATLGTENADVARVYVEDIKKENRGLWSYSGIATVAAVGLLIALLYKQCGPDSGEDNLSARENNNCSSYQTKNQRLEGELQRLLAVNPGSCATPRVEYRQGDCSTYDARIRDLEGQLAAAGRSPTPSPCAICASPSPCQEHTPCATPVPGATPKAKTVYVDRPGDCSAQDAQLAQTLRQLRHAQYCIDIERAVREENDGLFRTTIQSYFRSVGGEIPIHVRDTQVGGEYGIPQVLSYVCPTLENDVEATLMYRRLFSEDARTARSDLNDRVFRGR
ncbi:TPA: hypothetical protein HA241_02645 [Candidatus Woesearchaeota archaeon]|nr:hypothetical protein [Candidatus Woesearchaeota archaeon]